MKAKYSCVTMKAPEEIHTLRLHSCVKGHFTSLTTEDTLEASLHI